MTVDPWLLERRDDCERAFAFLPEEFDYDVCRREPTHGGFEIGYVGPGAGVVVSWYPRDPLTVWLVRPVDGALPPRGPDTGLNYFDFEDYEAVVGKDDAARQPVDLYTPSEANMLHLADRLRVCGPDLLIRSPADRFQVLEQRVRDRAEAFARRAEK